MRPHPKRKRKCAIHAWLAMVMNRVPFFNTPFFHQKFPFARVPAGCTTGEEENT